MSTTAAEPSQTDDVMALLRAAGSDGHRRVDRVVLARLRGLTPEGYADLLTDLAAVHLPLDLELRRGAPIRPRPVREPLAADLLALGRRLPEPGPAADLASTPARALGVLYVVEGSAAGGPTVAHLVQRHLGASAPVSFLLRGDGDPTWWQDFGALARSTLLGSAARAEAADATRATFRRFAHRLDG